MFERWLETSDYLWIRLDYVLVDFWEGASSEKLNSKESWYFVGRGCWYTGFVTDISLPSSEPNLIKQKVPFGGEEIILRAGEERLFFEVVLEDFEVFGLMNQGGNRVCVRQSRLLIDGVFELVRAVLFELLVHMMWNIY